jgi:hypothetical protein
MRKLRVEVWVTLATIKVKKKLSFPLMPINVKIKTCKTIILPVDVYGYETWSLKVREECRLEGIWEKRVEEFI